MTQERRFEIEEVANRYDSDHLCIMFRECLAEIDRLTSRNESLDGVFARGVELAAENWKLLAKIDRLTADRADLYAALDACVDTLRAIHMTYGFGSCKSQTAADQVALEVEIDKAWGPAVAALRRVTDRG